ncbi:ABC transporter substrate-binding protein [bacterium]|nr:ABC transporter substrate-binding protein [bacterium]
MRMIIKNKMKIVLFFSFLLFWTMPVSALTVAVIRDQRFSAYNEAYAGFKQRIKKGKKQIKFVFYNLQEKRFEKVIGDIILKEPDLILTLGGESTRLIKKRISRIPVIFCLVLNPVGKGVVKSRKSSMNNFTGVCLDIPVSTQFLALKQIIPFAKRIGVIYNPVKSSFIIKEGKKVTENLGLRLVSRIVNFRKEVPEAVKTFKDSVDVLWAVVDTTVYTSQSITFILETALKNKMPVLGFSVNMVKKGALLALYPDYKDMGRQAGEIALRIIDGEKPREIPISFPRKVNMAVNLKVAKLIGIDIPEKAMKNKKIKFFK